jgi:hypothetical protein
MSQVSFIASGHDVLYQECDGGHQVPASITEAALDWFLGTNQALDRDVTYGTAGGAAVRLHTLNLRKEESLCR